MFELIQQYLNQFLSKLHNLKNKYKTLFMFIYKNKHKSYKKKHKSGLPLKIIEKISKKNKEIWKYLEI